MGFAALGRQNGTSQLNGKAKCPETEAGL